MIIAIALAHVGRARTKKLGDAPSRHKTALIFYGFALVVMLLSIPWPGTPGGRPLFRGFGDAASYAVSGFPPSLCYGGPAAALAEAGSRT
jgi:hypothetical protein